MSFKLWFFKPFKSFLRWLILGAVLFFLATSLRAHWQEVATIRLGFQGYGFLICATLVTLGAHIWAGWIWAWILADLQFSQSGLWSITIYLKTNIAKYLPGNFWHFYSRVWATRKVGVPVKIAVLSVVLEPLLMAAAALVFAVGSRFNSGWSFLSLIGILAAVHPRCLNPLLSVASRAKLRSLPPPSEKELNPTDLGLPEPSTPLTLHHYPVKPLLGEMGFLGLRGAGFLLTIAALHALPLGQIPGLLSGFSFAWVLGLVVPGAPGGLGVFEATAIVLLEDQMPPSIVLAAVALYRLISILAEAIGAGIGVLYDRGQQDQG